MSTLLTGDKRISGDLQRSKVVSRRKQHRDLDLSLKIHPIRKDIIPLKDENGKLFGYQGRSINPNERLHRTKIQPTGWISDRTSSNICHCQKGGVANA